MMKTIAFVAISIDGCITRHKEEGNTFTSDAEKAYFSEILKDFDCTILGSKTFQATRKYILDNLTPDRLRVVLTSDPGKYARCQRPEMLEFERISPSRVIGQLEKREKSCCALLGGQKVFTSFPN